MKPTHQSDGIPEIDPAIPENAVRLYEQSDAMDDFPVLKAFQQYIDAEQAKARKRMLMLCVFFGALMIVVIAVFLLLLLNVSSRNQTLNDRLVEYAMKERERMASPIVVQPPQQQQQDNSILLSLTAKLEDMQKRLDESRQKAEEARRQAEIEAAKPKGPTPEELEIKRLNALLAAEKEKQAAEKARQAAEKEKERQHQLEIEAYRRKHYPEFYEKEKAPAKPSRSTSAHDELMQEIDKILEDGDAITYYDEAETTKKKPPRRTRKTAPAPAPAPKKEYSIPVDIRGSSSRWSVPNE